MFAMAPARRRASAAVALVATLSLLAATRECVPGFVIEVDCAAVQLTAYEAGERSLHVAGVTPSKGLV